MDTELFMECEDEELEPWQQVDDSVEEDDVDYSPETPPTCSGTSITPAPGETSSSPSLMPPPLPPSSSPATPLVSQTPPLILTQTNRGALLLPGTSATAAPILLTAQAFPLQTMRPGTSLVLNLPSAQSVPPLTLIHSPPLGPLVRPGVGVSSVLPQTRLSSTLTGVPTEPASVHLPTAMTIQPSKAGHVSPHISQVGGAKASESPGLANAMPPRSSMTAPGSSPVKVPSLSRTSDPTPGRPKVVLSVDEFYYGTLEGTQGPRKPNPLGAKASSFTCQVCSHPVNNNLRLVQHTLQHSPLIRGGDVKKLCTFCFRQFSNPTQLLSHRELVHGSAPSSNTCRICEWSFDNESAFLNHMRSNHKPGEMPYVCQVCSYRSSFYSDVLQHFASFHRDSHCMLCVFCLKVTRNVASYQQHVLRHKVSQAFHCSRCRLQFVFLKDKTQHKLENHHSVRRPAKLEGLPLGSKVTIRMYSRKRPPMTLVGGGAHLLQNPSSLIQPIKIKTEQQNSSTLRSLSQPPQSPPVRPASVPAVRLVCLECGSEASDLPAHFPTHVRCLLCAYSSCCSRAYAAHMIHHHVPRSKGEALPLHRLPPPCPFILRCSCCDFTSPFADKMAEHLVVNSEHRTVTCHSRLHAELDIHISSNDEPPQSAEEEKPVQNEDWRSVDCWKQPLENPQTKTCIRPFTETSGPHHSLQGNGEAIDYFNLVFPAALVELIMTETNTHAKICRYMGFGCPDWVPVTTREIKGFIGLCILMGIQNLPELSQYWSSSDHDNSHTFHSTMTLGRFKQVASNIRMGSFATNEHRRTSNPNDSLHIFRPMLDILGRSMWDAYRPNCCLTIDRALLPRLEGDGGLGTGDSKSQPQVWLLCDSKSGYCHRFFIQTSENWKQEVGFSVVPELVKGLEDKHHQLYLANSLASVPLVKNLLEQGIYSSSSFPPPSRILPRGLWQDGQLSKPGDFLQRRLGALLATRWKDTKEMGCLSTNADVGEVDTVWRRSQTKVGGLDPMNRPMAFRLLQENMRGVDICKQLLACNPLGGILQDRHWRGLFWFMVNLSVVNSFIVLRESRKRNPPAWVQNGLFTQANFRKQLGCQLAKCAQRLSETTSWRRTPKVERTDEAVQQRHRMAKISVGPKRCRNCNIKNIRHESVFGCVACRVNLCKQPQCFWEFHGLSPLNKGSTKVGFLRNAQSGEVEAAEVQDHMAPVEDMDSSEDEELDELEESKCIKEEEPLSPSPDPEDTCMQSADSIPQEQKDCLSPHQLRVTLLALCGGLHQASHVFSTEPNLIRSWLKEARKHLTQRTQHVHSEGEESMVAWVLSQREQQVPISESSLFREASMLKKNGAFDYTFRISHDWAVRFMLQYRLGPSSARRMSTLDRLLPQSLETKIRSFREFTQKVIRVHELAEGSIAVVDEFCLFVDLSSILNRSQRTEALQFTGSVPLMTVYLSALADGTMLPAVVLTNKQLAHKILPDFVVLEANLENLSAAEAFKLWTKRIWLQYLSGPVHHKKSMLVLDPHQEHTGDVFLSNISGSGTLPAVIPAGCSFILQPLLLCIKPALQRFLRSRWNTFSAGNSKELEEASPCQLHDNVTGILLDWLVEAFTLLKDLRQLWRKSFQLTGLLPKREHKDDDFEEGLNREENQQDLLKKLEKILLPSEDGLEPLEIEDSEEDETSMEELNAGQDAEPEEKGEEAVEGDETKKDGEDADQVGAPEEDSEEEGKETKDDRSEATKERRETRIMIGEQVGDEWKIATKSRLEGAEPKADEAERMDES
uniref:pogo transposable element with ZNF domain isoform X1 n=1 Tax=Doryrhamphus excisus TaxID=161450 RepID=UPI0025AEBD1B|nr:pogo transposable element with ZNF domain isoform X1 [Doryrhamphus excisus]